MVSARFAVDLNDKSSVTHDQSSAWHDEAVDRPRIGHSEAPQSISISSRNSHDYIPQALQYILEKRVRELGELLCG